MQAFKNVTITKKELLKDLKRHQKLDNFVRGTYQQGDSERGCAVGCSLMSLNKIKKMDIDPSSHSAYETHFGIPNWLAKLEDRIFEGVSLKRSKTWPVEFITAINVGADLNKVKTLFLIYVLRTTLNNFDHEKYPQVKIVINKVIKLYKSRETDKDKFELVAQEALLASSAAASYASSAAASAAASAASAYASAANFTAAAYASAAASASASYTSTSAAASYASAYASTASYDSARVNFHEKLATKLLQIIKSCK